MKRSPLVTLAWVCWVCAGACAIWAVSITAGLQGGLWAAAIVLALSAWICALIGADL